MKLQTMSDLHLEMHAEGGAELIRELDPTGVDLLVLAGDITTARYYEIRSIENGSNAFCTRVDGVRAEIKVVHGPTGKYLRTHPDGRPADNNGVEMQGGQDRAADGAPSSLFRTSALNLRNGRRVESGYACRGER